MISEQKFNTIKKERKLESLDAIESRSILTRSSMKPKDIITSITTISFAYLSNLYIYRCSILAALIFNFKPINNSIQKLVSLADIPPEGKGLIAFYTVMSIILSSLITSFITITRDNNVLERTINILTNTLQFSLSHIKITEEKKQEYICIILFLSAILFILFKIDLRENFTYVGLVVMVTILINFIKKISTIFTTLTIIILTTITFRNSFVFFDNSFKEIKIIQKKGICASNSTCIITTKDSKDRFYIIFKLKNGLLVQDNSGRVKIISNTEIKEILL